MKVLILSCNTGGGHNACAQALSQQLEKMGHESVTLDALGYVSDRVSRLVSNWHVRFYRHFPKLYGKGYHYAEEHPATFDEDSAACRILRSGCERMRQDIESGGYGAVICTHLFPAMMLSFIQHAKPLAVRTCFLATDYTASPSCNCVNLDVCVIPDASLTEEFVRAGIDRASIAPLGIPVRAMFASRTDAVQAKRAFQIDPAHRHLVIMSGSMGCGPIGEVVARIAKSMPDTCELSVVCSSNKKLYRKLRMRFGYKKNVHVLGFVKNISRLLDSADVFITKPGGISTTEAVVKGVPMVLINAVGGCETHNLEFFVSRGAACTADTPKELAWQSLQLLQNGPRLASMRRAMRELEYAGAAERICARVCE